MSKLKVGIVGLPNVGKSTLFSALTRKQVPAENYPFCTIDPNVGVVEVPDPRVEVLSKLSGTNKLIYATCEFVDIAGLVAGASKGEGLGNKFLANIRETDLVLHTVRCFEDDEVIHVAGKIDPLSDVAVIELELALSDLQIAEAAAVKLEKLARTQKTAAEHLELLQKAIAHLSEGLPLRKLDWTPPLAFGSYAFLTQKPLLYVANLSEKDYLAGGNDHYKRLLAHAESQGAKVLPISAALEAELAILSPEEAKEYLLSLGIEEPGLSKLIRFSYAELGLISFFTTGEKETRAWTIPVGSKAPQAAGAIHTDIEHGFIRAEVISYDDYVRYETRQAAKEAGRARLEGRDYVVQDGDVILFYHN